jgi:hypothetical protein
LINLSTWKILFSNPYKILMSDWSGNTIENIIDNNYINDNSIDGKKILDYSLKYFKMNPQNPYILFGWNNLNMAIETKIDHNYILTNGIYLSNLIHNSNVYGVITCDTNNLISYQLLNDNYVNTIWEWKITNLWSDLWTINSTLWTHSWNIWILQNYFLWNQLKLVNLTPGTNGYFLKTLAGVSIWQPIAEWDITNLWTNLWTINSTLWGHTTWINTLNSYFPITDANLNSSNLTNAMWNISTLQSYFPVTDSHLWSTNITNLLWDVWTLKGYFTTNILNSANLTNNISFTKLNLWSLTWNQYLYYNGTTITWNTPTIILWNPYTNPNFQFTFQNQIYANNQLSQYNFITYNPWSYTGIWSLFLFGNDMWNAIKLYYNKTWYEWLIIWYVTGSTNIMSFNNNWTNNIIIYGFLQHQYWTLSVWNDAYFITFYQFKQLLNINNNILSKNALLTSEASQYQVLNYNGWSFQWWLLNSNNIWWLDISKLWSVGAWNRFLLASTPPQWTYVDRMVDISGNGSYAYLQNT